MGPEGGDGGGTVVAKGTPEEIAVNPNSYTGTYLNIIQASNPWRLLALTF
jgi:excinuclease ABC subunit A